MFEEIIRLSEKRFLGFGIMMPWENNLEIQFGLWKEAVASQKINKLKSLSKSERAVGIFCYRCDAEKRAFSYHIACENKANASDTEFEELKINAGEFAVFKNACNYHSNAFKAYNDLCEEVWGQWLPNSGYTSLIELETFGCVEGYASIEIFHPDDPTVIPYQLEMLIPVKKDLNSDQF